MHDHVYRMGIAWQNVAYNQPPHLGYYIGDGIDPTAARLVKTGEGNLVQNIEVGEQIETISYTWINADGVEINGRLPKGITVDIDAAQSSVTISGIPEEVGTFEYSIDTHGGTTDISLPGTITVRKQSCRIPFR